MQFKSFHWLSHYTMLCKLNMVSKRVILGAFLFLVSSNFLYFGGVFNSEQLFDSHLLDMRLVMANSALRASLAICHLISNARS